MQVPIHLQHYRLDLLLIVLEKGIEHIFKVPQLALGLDAALVDSDNILLLLVELFGDLIGKVLQLAHALDLDGLNLCFEGFDGVGLLLIGLIDKLLQHLKLLIVILSK